MVSWIDICEVRSRAEVSYYVAARALLQNNGDMIEAVLALTLI